jgi:hypothetical protein
MSMEDLLGAMMSGQDSGGDQAADDPMAGLLGGLMGGGQGGAGGMAGLLGGGQQATAASAGAEGGGLLGMVLGSGMLDPIINGLAEKIGLPPETAQAVVAFVIQKLLAGGGSGERGPGAGDLTSPAMAQELSEQTGLDPETAEASLQEVVKLMGSGTAAAPGQDTPSPPDVDDAPPKPDLSGVGDLLDTF